MTPNEILRGIAESFQKTPNEITFALILIALFFGILTILFVLRIQYEKGKQRVILVKRYHSYIQEFALTPGEQNLINTMSQYMKTPGKKYLLFTNQHVFNNCLFELKKTTTVDDTALKTLLEKLHFKLFEKYHLPRTSREFLPGKHLMLVFNDRQKIKCRVESQKQNSTIVVCEPDTPLPSIGEPVIIYTYNAMGIIHFSTVIQDKKKNRLTLAHSDKLEALQRRHFFRKEVQMPVYIHSESSADHPVPSVILDLSAGGMSVKNPGKKFRKGDDVRITMHGQNELGFDLYGEVVRTSKRDDVAHILFGQFTPAQKDDIIRFLNTRSNTENKVPAG